MANPTGTPSKGAQEVLQALSAASKRKGQCVVMDALDGLDPDVREGFLIALVADRDEYPHRAIQGLLESLSGKRFGKDAISRHRRSINGLQGGCPCER